MPRKLTSRQLLVSFLALWDDVSQKEIAVRTGLSEPGVSLYLRKREMKDEVFEQILAAVGSRPAAVEAVRACLDSLEALDRSQDLTEEELSYVEEEARRAARLTREILTEATLRSRVGQAGDSDRKIKELCVQLCEESTQAASCQLEAAATLVRVAREIADKIPGPEGTRLQGQVAAYEANILRVTGELPAADAAFEESERLWQAGTDVAGVLDPGRRLDLKASLRRDQRRFEEALALLKDAEEVGRSRARVLIKKGFILEVMGEYERAVEILLEAEPLLDREAEPHLWLNQRLNRAVNCTHLGCYREAAELVKETQPLIAALAADLVAVRVAWLQGRIAAGLGRSQEARELLEKARREFASRNMSYDVALALLEEAALLLNDGRTAEVKTLAKELAAVFESKGVHREALAALRLFQEAAEGEHATAELARNLLRYLFRARYDQGLHFTAS
jgi:tetratricopeptide (TPR) repeat protein